MLLFLGDDSKKNEGKAQNVGGKVQDAASGAAKSVGDTLNSAKEAVVVRFSSLIPTAAVIRMILKEI
jgi:hypothetical protein